MERFRILVVDDVEENIHSLKMMVSDSFDVDIFTALSAQRGMDILMKEDVNLILTDIQMPEIDGFEFAQYLQGIEKTKDIPLIFITGIYNKDEYQKKGYELGAIDYITKPIDGALLNAKLKVYIYLFDMKRKREEELHIKDKMLIHQAKMATMGEMIGVIAHQLKQPLTVLSLSCIDLKASYELEMIDDKYIDNFSNNTENQIKFLSATIDGFKDFFSPHKVKSTFLLKEGLDETLKLIEKQFQTHDIKVNLDVGEEKIFGVKTELVQVVLNLLTNAKDAFLERKIENRMIKITSGSTSQHTLLVIQDNAGGVSPENVDKLFDPYFTTKKEGTGTGLYMVSLVIKESFNGDLKMLNVDNGVKFIIALPNKKHSEMKD